MKIFLFSLFILTLFFSCSQKQERVSLDSVEFKTLIQKLESGRWSWEKDKNCENFESYTFNLSQKQMVLKLKNPVEIDDEKIYSFTYEILWGYKNGFRGKIINENRLDKNNKPVQWDLILVNNNTFYWKRNDWDNDSGTKYKVKCK